MRPVEEAAAPSGLAGAPPWAGAPPGVRARAAAGSHAPEALFLGLLMLGLAPIWLVPHVPTQDGGNHVESVIGLLRLPHSPLLQRYYLPNYGFQPNWLTQALFAGLAQLVSPRLAEKLVLSGYLVLLPLAFRHALPRTERGRWTALAIFPFLHGYTFHMGFWNFCYSLALFFMAVGLWYRRRGRLTARSGLAFSAVTLVLFCAHSVSTAAAFAAIAAVLAWRGGLGLWRARGRARRRAIVLGGYARRALATFAWATPALGLMALFLVRQPKPVTHWQSLYDTAKHFASLYTLVSLDRRELLLTFPVVVVIAATVVLVARARVTRVRPVDGWLAAAALATALYFLTPDSVADGAQINDRLALYPFFAALLWLGWSSAPLRTVRRMAIALVLLFAAATVFRLFKYQQIDGYLAEYESVAPHVAEGSTLLPLTFAPFGPRQGGAIDGKKLLSYRVQVFQHASGWIAADRHGIDLDNSQAKTSHTPLRWRDELNPFTYLNTKPYGLEEEPPCVELWPYRALGGRIDYVLVWGATAKAAESECGGAVLAELRRDYERVYVSQPRGMAELWRVKGEITKPSPARRP